MEQNLLYKDELSGAFNRRYYKLLQSRINFATRDTNTPITIAITDIDHFKEINDIYGHLKGDKAIKFFASFLQKNLRNEDIIIRYGGDEFVIVQNNLAKNDAFLIWERLIEKLKNTPMDGELKLSISTGVASFPEDGDTIKQLFEKADERLYIAKRTGRGKVGVEQSKSIKIPPMKFVDRLTEKELLVENINKGIISVIRGEAGIGKTRLIREVLSNFKDVNILWSDCLALERKIPYYPLRELIKYRIKRSGQRIIENMPHSIALEIKKIVPDAFREYSSNEDAEFSDVVDRYRLFEGFNFVIGFGGRKRIVIVDNIQWIDEDSREALKYLIRENSDGNTVFVFATRVEETNPVAEDFLKTVSREKTLREIILNPLSDRFLKEVISIMLGDSIAKVEDYIVRRIAGNTFYAEELLKALYEVGALLVKENYWVFNEPEKEILPSGVRDITKRKFELMSQEAQELLKIISVARKGYIDLLIELSELNEGLVFDAIEEGLKSGLLKEHEDEELVTFRAEVIRLGIYQEEISNLKKRRLHKKIADWLSLHHLEGNEEEIAHHYQKAQDYDNVVIYGERAGDKTRKIYAFSQALKYYTWTKEAIEKRAIHPNDADKAEKQKYLLILLKIASTLEHLGRLNEASDVLKDTANLAETLKIYDVETKAINDLSNILYQTGNIEEAFGLTEKAITIAKEHGLKNELLNAYNTLGILLDSVSKYKEALKVYRKALSIAEELDDVGAQARLFNDIALIYQYTGKHSQALKLYKKAEGILHKRGNLEELLSIKINISLFYEMQGKLEKALLYAKEALKLAEKVRDIPKKARLLNNIGVIYIGKGDLKKAEDYLLRTLKINNITGDKDGVETCYINLGIVFNARGDIKKAIEYYKKALAISIKIQDKIGEIISRLNLGLKFSLTGEFEEAEKLLKLAIEDAEKSNLPALQIEALNGLAELNIFKNNLEHVKNYLEAANKIVLRHNGLINKLPDIEILQATYFITTKEYSKVKNILENLESKIITGEKPETYTKFLLIKARLLLIQKDYEDATKILEQIAESLNTYRDAFSIAEYNLLMGMLTHAEGKKEYTSHIKRAKEIFSSMGVPFKFKEAESLLNNK